MIISSQLVRNLVVGGLFTMLALQTVAFAQDAVPIKDSKVSVAKDAASIERLCKNLPDIIQSFTAEMSANTTERTTSIDEPASYRYHRSLPIGDGYRHLLVFASHGPTCHACAVDVSLMEISKIGDECRVDKSFLNALVDGQWGQMSEEYGVLPLSTTKFGFYTKFTSMGQGYMSEGFRLLTERNGLWDDILRIQSGADNSGAIEDNDPRAEQFSSEIKIENSGQEYNRICAHKSGMANQKPIKESVCYIYKNGKYEPRGY